MTTRNPLILDAENQRIRELPLGDDLDLSGNDISAVRNIIPEGNELYDLGSPTNRWRDIYLSGNTIDLNGATISATSGVFQFIDASGNDAVVSLAANTTDDLTEGSTNLYYLDSRVDSHLSGGTGVTYSNGAISIGQSVGTTDNVIFNDLTVDGDLVVNGSSTTLNTTTLDVEDLNITVASGATDSVTADGAGLTVDGANATLTYSNASDRFVFNKDIEATTLVGQVSDISNHDTDDLSEGTNLYYTDTRSRNALSASGDLSYNSTTGTFSFTERTDAEVRGLLSAAGDLSYNSTTGEFSVTTFKSSDFDSNFSGKSTTDLSEGTNLYYTDARVDAHLSGGSGIDFSTGTISHSDTSTVSDVTSTSNTFVDALTFDGFGHVTAVSTSTAAPPNDATITVSAGTGLSGGGNFTTDQSGNETITLDVDTSTIATRSYVDTEVSNLVDSSPATLDTLNELAAALGDDPNFATTVANDIGTKADKTTDINAGSGLTGGGDLSADRTISHADTSTQASVSNSGNTVIQSLTLDDYGHITGLGSTTIAAPNDSTITLSAGNGLTGGGSFTTNQSTGSTVSFAVASNSIGADELTVADNGTAGQALLSDGDGTFSWGAAGADITNDTTTNSSFYPTLSGSTSGTFTSATVSSTKLYFNPSTGTLNATEFNSLSDVSLKENVETLENGLGVINQIRPVAFDWKDSGEKSFGVIAQEIEEVLPQIVATNDDGIKSVAYDKIIAFLIDAVKTLDERTRS